jgi:CRP-like cAMP-binding protein
MADLLDLASDLPERVIPAGESLLVEGTTTGTLFVLVDGAVEVRRGDAVLAVVAHPGECLGEISALLGRPHGATVVALVPSRVRVAPDGAAFLQRPDVARHIATGLAHRLETLNAYLVDVREQYAGAEGHLGLVHEVLADLASGPRRDVDVGSEREPDPRY